MTDPTRLATRGPLQEDLSVDIDSVPVNNSDPSLRPVQIANQGFRPPIINSQADRVVAEADAQQPTGPKLEKGSSIVDNQGPVPLPSRLPIITVTADETPIEVDNDTWDTARKAVEQALESNLFKPETYPATVPEFTVFEGQRISYRSELPDLINDLEESKRFLGNFVTVSGPEYNQRAVKERN